MTVINPEQMKLYRCVDDFAADMKRKLHDKYIAGKSGWDDPAWTIDDVLGQLKVHIDKGDPVDVANYAMFVWYKEK